MSVRTTVLKATIASIPNSVSDTALGKLAATVEGSHAVNGVLEPPYPPQKLTKICELSSSLNQHVEAIVTNVDQFGWKYEPSLKLEAVDIRSQVKDALYCAKIITVNGDLSNMDSIDEPTEEEVTAKIKELTWTSKYEINKLKTFFFACNPDGSFIALRAKTRRDLEITGNAYWEVLRDQNNVVSRFVLAPVKYMRLSPVDKDPVEVNEQVPTTDISWTTVKQKKFFRRFVEVHADQKTIRAWFKEYGDTRTISRKTGKIYENLKAFEADEAKIDGDVPATEIIHFYIYSPETYPYGSPRWIGNLPAVLGSRELDEVNLGYFENRTVPPLALLVSGGKLSKGVVPRIEEFIEQNVKGRKNFHKILILEAEGQKAANGITSSVPTIKFVPLREAQQQDALFQQYDEANWQKIGSSFRLPRILVGRDRSINRATATASIRFAEEQVFEPIRNSFDELINRNILPELGIKFWRYRSNTPITRDPELLAAILTELSDAGLLTPAEGRVLAADVFNRDLPQLTEAWTQQPFKLSIAEAKNMSPEVADPAGAKIRDLMGEIPDEDVETPDPQKKNHHALREELELVELGSQ